MAPYIDAYLRIWRYMAINGPFYGHIEWPQTGVVVPPSFSANTCFPGLGLVVSIGHLKFEKPLGDH